MACISKSDIANKWDNDKRFSDIHGLILELTEKLSQVLSEPDEIKSEVKENGLVVGCPNEDISKEKENSWCDSILIDENDNISDAKIVPDSVNSLEDHVDNSNQIEEIIPDIFDISTEKDHKNISLCSQKEEGEKETALQRKSNKKTDAEKQALRNLVRSLILKKNKRIYCSECPFTSKHHFSFYSHCKRMHTKVNRTSVDEGGQLVKSSEKNLYYCGLCAFVSFMANGMKIHSSVKHPDAPTADFDNCVSVLDPKAEQYYRAYIETIDNARQYKRAQQQLKYYFPNRLLDQFQVDERPILCMLCSVKHFTPNDLFQHYRKDHGTKGPKRNKVDHLYHCEKCLHTSSSYRIIHYHFAAEHNVLDSFKQDNMPEVESTDDEAGNDEEIRDGFLTDILDEDLFAPAASLDALPACSGGDIFDSLIKASENEKNQLVDVEKTMPQIKQHENCEKIDGKRKLTRLKSGRSKLIKYSDVTPSSESDISGNEAVLSSPKKRRSSDFIRSPIKSDLSDVPPDLEGVVKCDKCSFATSEIKSLINHWKGSHNKVYPRFVLEKVLEYYKKDSFTVLVPKKDISPKWVNGYMNPECTALVQNPVFLCSHCEFYSTYLNTIYTHYASKHPSAVCSASTLVINESNPEIMEEWKNRKVSAISSKMYRCKIGTCQFSSYFYRNIAEHLVTQHFIKFKKEDLEKLIRSLVVYRCTKCDVCLQNYASYFAHVQANHRINLVNFTMNQFNEYKCELCTDTYINLNSLYLHLKEHSYIPELPPDKILIYCCSICRRAFRAERFMRHHYTRMHVEWTDKSFTFKDIPSMYHCKPTDSIQKLPMIEEFTDNVSQVTPPSPPIDDDLEESGLETMNKSSKSPKTIYFCPLCKFSSMLVRGVRIHLRKSHRKNYSDMRVITSQVDVDQSIPTDEYASVDPALEALSNRKVFTKCSHDKWIKRNPKVYEEHIKWRHFDGRSKKCSQCPNYYICAVIRQMHITRKHSVLLKSQGKLSYRCNHRCTLGNDKAAFNKHVEEMHRVYEPFHCPHCTLLCMCGSIMFQHLRKRHFYTEEQIVLFQQQKELNSQSKMPEIDMVPAVVPATNDIAFKKRECYKDYTPRKSVRVLASQWKCIFCQTVMPSYLSLRKHVAKSHNGVKIVRCRWCDFITKDGIQLSNHQKIHQVFVGQMMKELRQIWKAKRKSNNQILQNNFVQESNRKITELTDDTNIVASKISDQQQSNKIYRSPRKVSVQTARKSMRSSQSSPSKLPQSFTTSQKDFESSNIEQSFSVASNGKLLCNFCSYEATDKIRIMIHLKGNHVQHKTYHCQLCYFKSQEFPNVASHLRNHHKMERNHHFAIKMLFHFGEHPSNALKNRSLMAEFEPGPSLPTTFSLESSDCANNYLKQFIPEITNTKSTEKLVLEKSFSNYRINDYGKNKPHSSETKYYKNVITCKYCNAETSSSYEMEVHLKRHEVATLGTMSFTESDFLYSQFF